MIRTFSQRTIVACHESVRSDMGDAYGPRRREPNPAVSALRASVPIATPLARLLRAVFAAEERLRDADQSVSDAEYSRLDDAAIDARVALREYLANQGLTQDEINRIGGVL